MRTDAEFEYTPQSSGVAHDAAADLVGPETAEADRAVIVRHVTSVVVGAPIDTDRRRAGRETEGYSSPMSTADFSVGRLRGAPERGGIVDHRLARRMLVNQVRIGRLRRDEVCDAHPELIRAAANVGTETEASCPICEEENLRLVTYVFGHRLPAHGRCVSSAKELRQLATTGRDLRAYVVEACCGCRWHHLLRVFPV